MKRIPKNIIILTVLASFAACKGNDKPVATEAAAPAATPATDNKAADNIVSLTDIQEKNAGIATGKVEKRSMHSILRVSGVIDVPPQNTISVSIPLGGYLKQTALLPGTRVSKGMVLAILEDQQYIQLQQDYLTAKSKLQFAEADFNRQQGLNATKAVSDKTFEQARSEYEGQRILQRSLAEKLRLIGINPDNLNENNISRSIRLYSPINGYVSKVNVNIGKYVSPTDVLFELINPNDLHLSLTVLEDDAARLTPGQALTCYLNSKPSVKYKATLKLITPAVNSERAVEVHCHLHETSKDLMPGMFMNAELEINQAQVLAVPDDAVVKWNGAWYIFVEKAAHQYQLLPVETGISGEGYTAIKTPLPQSPIVIKNAYTLLTKMKNTSDE